MAEWGDSRVDLLTAKATVVQRLANELNIAMLAAANSGLDVTVDVLDYNRIESGPCPRLIIKCCLPL